VRNATALMLSGAGTAVLGVIFWSVAAHRVDAATIGRSSAEISAITLVATLAQLGIPAMFERFLPVSGRRTHIVIWRAYGVCVAAALILSVGYLAFGFGTAFISTQLPWRAFFVLATVLWTIFALQDSVLVGLRATRWVPVENIAYSGAKLALLPVLVVVSATNAIVVAWVAPVAVAILAVNWYLFVRRVPFYETRVTSSEELPSLRHLFSLAGAQYVTLLINVLTPLVAVIIVIRRLGPVAGAHYYLPALVASGVSLFLGSIVRSFLVEASSEPENLARHARVALRTTALVVVVAVVVGVAAAPLLLRLFGSSYAAEGATLLRLMLVSLVGFAVTDFYSAFALLDKRVWRIVVRELLATTLYFVLVLTLIGHLGIVALGIATLVNASLQGLLFLPALVTRLRALR
jgi:O-antigen/teichoic acid export membrane protein